MDMGTTCPPLLGALLPRDGAKFSARWSRILDQIRAHAAGVGTGDSIRGRRRPPHCTTVVRHAVALLLLGIGMTHHSTSLAPRCSIFLYISLIYSRIARESVHEERKYNAFYIFYQTATVHHAASSLPIFV
jgi:hypothetical protein